MKPMNRSKSTDHQHPRATYDQGRMVLVVHGPYPYEIDLERCNTPARLLQALLELSKKPWCDRALAGEVVAAVDSACMLEFGRHAHRVYSPSGQAQLVDWDGGFTKPLESR